MLCGDLFLEVLWFCEKGWFARGAYCILEGVLKVG